MHTDVSSGVRFQRQEPVKLVPAPTPAPTPTPTPAPTPCCATVALQPNSIYTLTTLPASAAAVAAAGAARAGAGPESAQSVEHTSLAAGSPGFITPVEGVSPGCGGIASWHNGTRFPLPYAADFTSLATAARFRDFPVYLSDMQGIFRLESLPTEAETTTKSTRAKHRQEFARRPLLGIVRAPN